MHTQQYIMELPGTLFRPKPEKKILENLLWKKFFEIMEISGFKIKNSLFFMKWNLFLALILRIFLHFLEGRLFLYFLQKIKTLKKFRKRSFLRFQETETLKKLLILQEVTLQARKKKRVKKFLFQEIRLKKPYKT